ncbi:MAG TPA: hypothetical protein VF832_15625 [Longimicrobiales bacterium]
MRVSRIFLPIAALAVAACNDNLGPLQWSDVPDTVTLYSASRAALTGQVSSFDFTAPRPVILESSGTGQSFDVVLTDQNGAFSLLPSGALLGQTNRAGIAAVSADSLKGIRKAVTDTGAYQQKLPVPVRPGSFLIVRSRRVSCVLTTGSYYAKLQVISVDPAAGTMKFAFVRNPSCGDQTLIPPG